MAQTEVSIRFDGPALAGGQMDVRALAPALYGLAALIQEAQATAFPNDPRVSVDIVATSQGSFHVALAIIHEPGLWEQFRDLFSGAEVSALTNLEALSGLVIGSATGLFGLIKWVRRRKVTYEVLPNGMVRVRDEDEVPIDVPAAAWYLYVRPHVRQHAYEAVEPLEREGIDEFEFRPTVGEPVSVAKRDLPAFHVDPDEELILGEEDVELNATITTAAFSHGAMWRLNWEGKNNWVDIRDDAFVERVQSRQERFSKDDVLRVVVRRTQYDTPKGEKERFSVMRVVEHHSAPPMPVQQRLALDAPVDAGPPAD